MASQCSTVEEKGKFFDCTSTSKNMTHLCMSKGGMFKLKINLSNTLTFDS